MKRLMLLAGMLVFVGASQAQAPTKLFDVSNANGAVVGGITADRATIIWYRDNAAKNKVMQAFGDAYGYQATVPDPNNPGQTIPNPQGLQVFFNKQISNYVRDVVRGQIVKAAATQAATTAGAAEDADLPPQGLK